MMRPILRMLAEIAPLWLAVAAAFSAVSTRAEDYKLPAPKVVDPGPAPAQPAPPPADAIVLFDGKDFAEWSSDKGKDVVWTLSEGNAMTCKPGSGSIMTRRQFGAAQIHVEFATPLMPEAKGQDRGNSGVYMQGRYEVQVLDSYQSATYPDGQCGAIYGFHPPLVNACRPPGEWQTYDIIFRAPSFSAEGVRTSAALLTVFHNGILIQDHADATKSTTASMFKETPHQGPGPIVLQDHGNLVRYRNIWVRPLE